MDLADSLAEIERLREILRQCMRGADTVDLGNGEIISLYLAQKPGSAIKRDDLAN